MNNISQTQLTATILLLPVLVLLMVSSAAAQPIIVDGNGSDWDSSWFLVADPFDLEDYGDYGYNLTCVWQHYKRDRG